MTMAAINSRKFVSSVEDARYELIWDMHKFSQWDDSQRYSIALPQNPLFLNRWGLIHVPTIEGHADKCGFVVRLLSPKNMSPGTVANFKISLLDSANRVFFEMPSTSRLTIKPDGGAEGCCTMFRSALLENIMPADKLTVKCAISSNHMVVTRMVVPQLPGLPAVRPSVFTRDMERLADDRKFSDVKFRVGNETFLAHKCILSTRSPVFEAMFEHPMQESSSNLVTIEDVEPTVFDALLRYIYSDKVTCLDTKAKELYIAADKYDIATLRSICRNSILDNLCPENVAETLILADLHSDAEMKRFILTFLSNRCKACEVTKLPSWKSLVTSHPHLVGQAFEALVTPNGDTEEGN